MRSKFHFLTTGLATLFLLSGVSCSDDEASVPTPPGEGILTPPVLTLSAEEVLVEPEEPDQTVLHAEWSAATDDPEVDVRYSLYVNHGEGDMFTNPLVFDAGTELSYDFTNEELNRMLISDFEIEPGVATPLRLVVYAENRDDEFDTQLSQTLVCTVTAQTAYPAYPPAVYLVGAATSWGWDLTQALEIPETSPGSHRYEASDIELRVQPASINNGFKLYFSRNLDDLDDPRFAAQDLGSDTFGNITRLDNALEGLPKRLEMNEMELDNIKKQFETAKVDVERPFPQEEELKAKTDRLNELNALLNVDKRENEIVGGEPDEGEEPPEKKPRDLER